MRTLLARHRGSRVLVFTADNAAAYAISREHLIMPITCEPVHARVVHYRKRILPEAVMQMIDADRPA